MDEKEILAEALGNYWLTPPIELTLGLFFNNPYESLIVVDGEAKIQFLDRRTEKLFGLRQGEARGADIRDFIPQSGLPLVLETGKAMIGRIFEVNGKRRIGSLYPIIHKGRTVGALGRLIFHSLEEVEKINSEIRELKNEINYLKEKELHEYSSRYTFDNILGNSALVKDAIELAKKIAMINTDVLIIGESGTGKELFAHSIHSYAHGDRHIIKINCPAIPFELAESELFGYEKGAFSGALSSGKPGKFEMAHNGTVFLDEISSLPLSIQAKLLRVLQEREIERLGSTKPRKVNFRIIAATNTDLRELVKEGKFREDLYYRLAKAVFPISPLRERKEDISLYISHFLGKINLSFGTRIKNIGPRAMEMMLNYNWPGNVRELINVLEQAVLRAWKGEMILEEHLPPELKADFSAPRPQNITIDRVEKRLFKAEMEEREREVLLSALKRAGGNRTRAALLLDMPRSTLYEKIRRYGL